jgi:sulfur-carrier protein
MSVTFGIPGPLRGLAGGQSQVQIAESPPTLRDALELLWRTYPSLRDRVVNEEGQVRAHVNIFVDNESVRFTGGLATPIPPGTEIFIIPAVSGG